MSRLVSLGSGLAIACLSPFGAFAQAPPSYSSVDPAQALPDTRTPGAPLQTPGRPASGDAATAEGARFVLKAVTFKGATALSAAALERVWTPYRDRSVNLDDLRRIASDTEAAYEAAGYPFVAVVVPPQQVADGQVELQVVEARISDLTVLGLDPVARRQVTAAFEPLIGRAPLPAGAVQTAYNNAQAVPGLSVAGALRAGSQPGGMDLVVQARRRTWRGYINVNNYYSDPAGPWGVLAGADYYGASLYGDRTTLQLYSALDKDEQRVVRLSHYRGLRGDGTSISADILVARARPGGFLTPLEIATDVTSGHIEVGRPMWVRNGFALQGTLSIEATDQKTRVFSNIDLTHDRLRIAVARLSGSWTRRGLNGVFAAEARQGLSIGGASDKGDVGLSRADADPRATVFRASTQVEARLPLKMTGWLSLQGQAANRSLAAPEEFSVGALTIGRGYDPGASFGDSAFGYSAELRTRAFPVRPGVTVQPFAFADGVKVWNKEAGAPNGRWVSSSGAGFRVAFLGRAQLDLTYAVPASAPLGLGEPKPQPKLLANLTLGVPDAFQGLSRLLHRGSKRR